MDDFDCTTAGRAIAAYVDELSNWYVRLNRRRFWDGDAAAFATLRHCLIEVAKLLAPFTPFVADEIHANLTGDGDSVHLADFPEPDPELADGELEAGVEAAMRAIELGRAARAQAKVKNRQPLRRAVIVATDSRAGRDRAAGRAGARPSSTSRSSSSSPRRASWSATRSSPTTGPSVRGSARRCLRWRRRSRRSTPTTSPRRSAASGGSASTSTAHDHALQPEDLTLVMQPLEGYEVEAEAGRAVALALELDEELVREGLAREIVHAVQNARKRVGLDVSDRIALTLGGDAGLVEAARAHEAYVAGEVLATSVSYEAAEPAASATIEGRELEIGIEKGSPRDRLS